MNFYIVMICLACLNASSSRSLVFISLIIRFPIVVSRFTDSTAECSNPECMYRHVNPEDKVKECPWYARGFCKHGIPS